MEQVLAGLAATRLREKLLKIKGQDVCAVPVQQGPKRSVGSGPSVVRKRHKPFTNGNFMLCPKTHLLYSRRLGARYKYQVPARGFGDGTDEGEATEFRQRPLG